MERKPIKTSDFRTVKLLKGGIAIIKAIVIAGKKAFVKTKALIYFIKDRLPEKKKHVLISSVAARRTYFEVDNEPAVLKIKTLRVVE